jgi:hypothetical protein
VGKNRINIQKPTLKMQTQKRINLMYKRKLPLSLRVMQKMECQRMWKIQPLGPTDEVDEVSSEEEEEEIVIGSRIATLFLSVTENTSASLSW